ncbi:hypothetical protein [Sorangium sp. So ce1335]|uniref:hypothetical protein n=1 Tax=Sorangium sp. So ce1335 TaxID=3133335 RepID=UPI003F61357E
MAKTRKAKKAATTSTSRRPAATPVAEEPEWTVEALTRALTATSVDEDIALLKRAGILTKAGKLAKLYTSWGDKVSRTPEINEQGEMEG